MEKDYYFEFYNVIDEVSLEYVSSRNEKNPELYTIGCHNISGVLINYLYHATFSWRNEYNNWRKQGTNKEAAKRKLLERLCENDPEDEVPSIYSNPITTHPWFEVLKELNINILIYIFNHRQLLYLLPLITKLEQQVLIIADYDIPDDILLPDNISAVYLNHIPCFHIYNKNILSQFPVIHNYFNILDAIIQILKPSCTIVLEGCHIQEQVIGTICRNYNIPCIGIQQGWPSLMRTGFRRFPYQYYFTWGEYFSKHWQLYNPGVEFIASGYMYPVKQFNHEQKNSITFFLQAPVLISDRTYFNDLLLLIKKTAMQFPNQIISVREHPEFLIDADIKQDLCIFNNIEFVTTEKLEQVYSETFISVSHFSSCLVEGLIHDCIPLVYDPSTGSRYYPDIEQDGFGLITSNEDSFLDAVKFIMCRKSLFHSNIQNGKTKLFSNHSDDTINSMIQTINDIIENERV